MEILQSSYVCIHLLSTIVNTINIEIFINIGCLRKSRQMVGTVRSRHEKIRACLQTRIDILEELEFAVLESSLLEVLPYGVASLVSCLLLIDSCELSVLYDYFALDDCEVDGLPVADCAEH